MESTESNDLVFQAIDWDFYDHGDEDEDGDGENDNYNKKFIIQVFGKTKKQQSVYVEIKDFKPSFYVEVDSVRPSDIDNLVDQIKNKMCIPVKDPETGETMWKKASNGLDSYKVIKKHKFWGFTANREFKFLQLNFDSYEAFKAGERACNKEYKLSTGKRITLESYESNIIPFLRFIHMKDLEAVGFMSAPIRKLSKRTHKKSCCDLNYSVSWNDIVKFNDRSIEKIIICAFDIECVSEDKISFPQAENKNDKVIQIGLTLSRYGEEDCYEKHLLALEETADIEGVNVQWFRTEEKLLLGFTDLLRKINPDIITGYNIFGFDFDYLKRRADRLALDMSLVKRDDFLNKFHSMSRIESEISEWKDTQLASSALGKNILRYFKMTGRVIIDLMKTIQSNPMYKLSSYKLDNVAATFIRENISNISNEGTSDKCRIDTKSTTGIQKNDYITIGYFDGAIEERYADGKKFQVIDIQKNYFVVDSRINTNELLGKGYKIFWSQAKDDMKPCDIFTMFEKTPKDRALIGKYCIMDCQLCNKLLAKLQIVTNNIGMANVCHVPLSYLFLRGQGVKIFSLVSKKCREKNHIMKVLKKKKEIEKTVQFPSKTKRCDELDDNTIEKFTRDLNYKGADTLDDEDEGYEGAIVFIPKPGVYFEPIPVLDYASLYPNSMILRNLSHETWVNDSDYENIPEYKYHTISYKKNNGETVTCKFAEKRDGTKGIIPEILNDLLTARKKYKKLMNDATDSFQYFILDGLQQAYKVTANSLYGQTGASTSPVCHKEIAASTTATGREMLQFSKHFIEHIYAKAINLALTNKKKYMAYMEDTFMHYPTEFDVINDEGENISIHVNTEKFDRIPEFKFNRKQIGYEKKYEFPKDIKNFDKLLSKILALEKKQKRKLKEMLKTGVEIQNSGELYSEFDDLWKDFGLSDVNKLHENLTLKLCKLKKDAKNEFFDNLTILIEVENLNKLLDCVYTLNPPDRIVFKDMLIKCITGERNCEKLHIKFKDNIWSMMKIESKKELEKFIAVMDLEKGVKNVLISNIDIAIDDMGYSNKEQFFEKFYENINCVLAGHTVDPQIIYGDSVTGDTPLILKNKNGKVVIKTIESLGNIWKDYTEESNKLHDDNIEFYAWTETGWSKIKRVIKHKTNKKIYQVLTHKGCVKVTEDHSLLDIYGKEITPNECTVDTELLHSFPNEFNMFDGEKETDIKDLRELLLLKKEIISESWIKMMYTYCLLKQLGINSIISEESGKLKLTFDDSIKEIKPFCKIKLISDGNETTEVYDLETENHHFQAGIGEIIVHNTDSVFFCPHIKCTETQELLNNKDSLCMAINLGIWASILITTMLPNPMAQEYEKVLWPFIIQGKKRYVGNLYEKDPDSFKQKFMGIELKRRDNAPIVKVVLDGIIRKILNERNPQGAFEFTRETLEKMVAGNIGLDKFIITKTLKGNALTKEEREIESLKPKEKRFYANRKGIVHAVLADRIADRDPGNKPLSNDRIPYAYVQTDYESVLQGDRVETPEYIIQNKLNIDYKFYISNQIMKPALKFLDLITLNAKSIFTNCIIKEENKRNKRLPLAYYANCNHNSSDSMEEIDNDTNIVFKTKTKTNKKTSKFAINSKKEINIDDLSFD
jgi:DNA polymerase elongation subunit (family B)